MFFSSLQLSPGRCISSLLRTAGAAGVGMTETPQMMKSSVHAEEDDFVPELQRSIHPRERPDWEETLSAMARGADIPDIPGELQLRSCGSTASMKVKNVKKLSFTKGHFPKMAECAHFHYENVDFGNIQLATGSSGKFLFPCFFPLVKWEEMQCGFCHGRIASAVSCD
uniref:Rho GTPase-activating protein 32 n=1 Tax=Junco hyemalis TaxID=40217 RepID=A0A8C5JK82_JUNHY